MLRSAIVIASLVALAVAHPTANQSRVVYGETAAPGQFPYQVVLNISLYQGMRMCGGCLLSDQWVLTAGHCVEKAESFEVILGTVDLYGETREVATATEFHRHEEYDFTHLVNDVALVKLSESVDLSDRVQPVKLPMGSDVYVDRKVIVSGWGVMQDGMVAEKLQFAPMKVISNNECEKTHNSIKETTICALGDEQQSPCHGDSGGPLVLADEDVLVGVVSYGHNSGCDRGHPAAFARVTSFVDWIKKNTGL